MDRTVSARWASCFPVSLELLLHHIDVLTVCGMGMYFQKHAGVLKRRTYHAMCCASLSSAGKIQPVRHTSHSAILPTCSTPFVTRILKPCSMASGCVASRL